jgi:hypothetical protein
VIDAIASTSPADGGRAHHSHARLASSSRPVDADPTPA